MGLGQNPANSPVTCRKAQTPRLALRGPEGFTPSLAEPTRGAAAGSPATALTVLVPGIRVLLLRIWAVDGALVYLQRSTRVSYWGLRGRGDVRPQISDHRPFPATWRVGPRTLQLALARGPTPTAPGPQEDWGPLYSLRRPPGRGESKIAGILPGRTQLHGPQNPCLYLRCRVKGPEGSL